MTDEQALLPTIPLSSRLALAYAPASARAATLGLFALDARLARLLRSASEPMLAQLRLAWWRELLKSDPDGWPSGEPLLGVLRTWQGDRSALVDLVDGWEELTGPAPLPAAALSGLADARAHAFGSLAECLGAGGERDIAIRLGRNWALADLATKLSSAEEQRAARALAQAQDWRAPWISRRLRPLAVLHALAERSVRKGSSLDHVSPGALAAAVRAGLLGR